MSENEPPPDGNDWWSSGAGSARGADNLGRIGGQPPVQPHPGYATVGYPNYPPPGYAQPSPPSGYMPYPTYPPPPYGGYGTGYPGMPQVLPSYGPGSLADPGSRLGARLLDAIFMIPVIVVAVILSTAIARPWETVLNSFGTTGSSLNTSRLLLWLFLTFAFILIGQTLYESLFTHHMGRTPGKAILHIRPQWDGHFGANLTFGRALARSVAYWSWGLIPYVGGILGFINVL
ncbi:MAG TPA: RDD family protein, partial [Acidimicrobiales bacterium]|nr:RDD family protein [Acidimicrobiales bacterium]